MPHNPTALPLPGKTPAEAAAAPKKREIPWVDIFAAPVIGLDPSANDTGFAVIVSGRVVNSGTWHPSKSRNAADRYDQLADFVFGLVRERQAPRIVAVEIPSGGQRHSATQLMVYARAVGVCQAAAHLAGAMVVPVPVNTWKGRTGKGQTALYVCASYGLQAAGRTDNELDAIGIADWYVRVGSRLMPAKGGAHAAL